METENQPAEWTFDVPSFKIFVINSNQRISIHAIKIETGEQFGPQAAFAGLNPSIIAENIHRGVRLSEVTDNSIKVRFECYIHPIELLLNQNTAVERENNLLKIEMKKLTDQVEILKKPKIFYFQTSVDDWKPYDGRDIGITVKVDFSHIGLKKKPHVQLTLNGTGCHWETTGSNCVFNLTPQSFDIYVRTTRFPINPQVAKQYGWYLSYVIHSLDD